VEDLLTVVGLIGVTLLLSVGKWLDGLREWLLGFSVRANPLRILGETLSCTISAGFFVGVVWSLYQADPWAKVFVWGGLISLAAYATDEALALVDAGVRRLVGRGPVMPPMPLPMNREKKEGVPEPVNGALTEDQAHAMIGGGDEEDE
jgi:hypothetical protein